MSREEDLLREIDELRNDRREADIQWRQNISDTLRDVGTKVEQVRVNQQEFGEKLATATEILTGNGNPEKGLVVRIDRVEQDHKTQSRWFWVIVPSAITGMLSAIWHYFKNP
jgi:hypothetical protein